MRNEIRIKDSTFTDTDIIDGNVLIVQSLSGEDLQWDTLDATLNFGENVPTVFRPRETTDGMRVKDTEEGQEVYKLLGVLPWVSILVTDPSKFVYGTEVRFLHKDSFGEEPRLIGKFFMKEIKRVGKNKYSISCMSAVGLLENLRHYGGFYNGEKFVDIVKDIVGGTFNYTVDPKLANKRVNGWLPIDTRRNNLHQLLFANSAIVIRNPDADGDPRFVPVTKKSVERIPPSNIFIDSDIKYPDGVSSVTVVEHTYTESQEESVLVDGGVYGKTIVSPKGVTFVDADLIAFDQPYHSLVSDGSQILESGANYVVLKAGACRLTGKKYNHTERQIVANGDGTTIVSSEKDNDVFIGNETLVSGLVADSLAKQLFDYYNSTKTVNLNMVSKGQNPGDFVAFSDPFGEATSGTIESLDANVSSQLKTKVKVVVGFSPQDETYSNVEVMTTNRSWTVPDGISIIRMVLIGGGDGGDSGGRGSATDVGKKGRGGRGGRVYITSIPVKPGMVFTSSIGAGGVGGVMNSESPETGQPGTFGGNSTLTEKASGKVYTSKNGVPSVIGYTDTLNDKTYGLPGINGKYDGGKAGETLVTDIGTFTTGGTGSSVRTSDNAWAGGGTGGGPAYGANGGDGRDAHIGQIAVYGGTGGTGAQPTVRGANATITGSGGGGGNGGGQGGEGGGSRWGNKYYSGQDGSPGAGGFGSQGGNGKSGCVLIFYGEVK